MSSFGTFLTNRPYRRNRGKVDLHQRFLRQRNKFYPKVITPKVNVIDPVLLNKSNQQHLNQETKTMQYKSCSQIVPTVGLTNLIFYDCHNQSSTGKSTDDSISQLIPSSSPATEYRHGSQFFIPEILMGCSRNSHVGISSDATMKSQDLMDYNFNEFARTRQPSYSSVQDFTLTSNGGSNFFPSYNSFEMDLNRRIGATNISNDLHSDIFSFDIDLDDKTNLISNSIAYAQDDTLENLNRQMNQNMSDVELQDLFSISGLCPQFNTPNWRSKTNTSQSDDESMAKFGVSSCSDTSLAISDIGSDFYADFVPLRTSTPLSERKTRTWEDTKNLRKEWSTSGLLGISDNELFSNHREENQQELFVDSGPNLSFPFSGMLSQENFLTC